MSIPTRVDRVETWPDPTPFTVADSRPTPGVVSLVAVLTAVGLVAVNVDLGTLGLPGAIPLSSLTWLVIAGTWFVVTSLALGVSPSVPVRADGATPWFALLAALAVASTAWSVHPARTLAAAVTASMVFVGAHVATRWLGWTQIVRIASLSLAAFLAIGIVRDVVLDSLLADGASIATGESRFAGISFSPTDLGRISTFAVVLSALAALAHSGRMRWVHGGGAVIGAVALATSGTRLVVLALLLVGAYAAVRRRTPSSILVGLLAVVAVLVVALAPTQVAESVARPGEPTSHVFEFAGRTPVWDSALEFASDRPVWGHGWAANDVVFAEAFRRDLIGFDAFNAHNLLLGVVIDLGAVGATVLILGLVALWRSTGQTPGARLVVLLVLLTGTIEATMSRPSLTIALLGATSAAAMQATPSRGASHG